jgi:hypothetical protein
MPSKGIPCKEGDVIQVGCTWANLNNRDASRGAIEILERLSFLPLRPSVVISSGYGYHVYYAFTSPLRLGKLREWGMLTLDFRDLLGCNDRVKLTQVLGLPGTLNLKERTPVSYEIVEEYSSWTRYGLEELRGALENSMRSMSPSGLPKGKGVSPAGYRLSPDALRRRGVGADLLKSVVTGSVLANSSAGAAGYDEESGKDFRIALTLYRKGFNEEEIKAIFRGNPYGCGRNWAQKKNGDKYLETLLRQVQERYSDTEGLSPKAPGGGDEGSPDESILPPGYVQKGDGSIWLNPPVADTERKPAKPVRVSSSPMRITAIHENIDTGQISVSVEFEYLGKTRSTLLPRSHMSSARQLVAALAGEGAPVSTNNARHVLAYLTAYEQAFASTIKHKKVTSRFGRSNTAGPFFFPGLRRSVEFAPMGPGDASLYRAYSSRRGSLQGWLKLMRVLSDEQLMVPQVAVLAALVPPLQRRLQIPNFILDLHGNTSTGKSTSLKLAASIYGRPHDPDALIMQWTNTQVAVEQVAGMCSELPIFLDDAQHCPAELKRSVIYMIANGRGKGRGGRAGGIADVRTWHTVALSTSEEPLHESSPHEGARGRIIPLGGSTLPFPSGQGSLVQHLERGVATEHGHAGEIYLRHLNGWEDAAWAKWLKRYSDVRAELLRGTSSNVISRVSGYVAAIQVAAEVACPLLGLQFIPDVIGTWLMLHLSEQQNDQSLVLLALRALADYYISNAEQFAADDRHGSGRRVPLHGVSKRHQYVGFLRSTLDSVFKARRWTQTAVLNKMAAAGVLLTTEDDRHTKKVCVDGVKHRMVCVKWSAILPEDDDGTA